jgi:hypothetical protein
MAFSAMAKAGDCAQGSSSHNHSSHPIEVVVHPTPQKTLVAIRDIVLAEDDFTLGRWSQVVDTIVGPVDIGAKRRIKDLLHKHEYGEAILSSLEIWYQFGDGRPDLLLALRTLGLIQLAGKSIEIAIDCDYDPASFIDTASES